jgi:hypothetical protein
LDLIIAPGLVRFFDLHVESMFMQGQPPPG